MIPLADEPASRRRFPFVNICLLLGCFGAFGYQLSLPEPELEQFVQTFGAVPYELASGQDVPPPNPWPVWTTLLTSMFLHAGWVHLLANALYLWVFGDNIESSFGHLKFLAFYLACGIAAGVAQATSMPGSMLPAIGASGAIAGVLGSYMLLHPGTPVTTLFLLGGAPLRLPVPAFLLIGFWFILQLPSGLAALGADTQQTGGVAYWAHIGGFLTGLVITGLSLIVRATRGGPVTASALVPPPVPRASVRGGKLPTAPSARRGATGATSAEAALGQAQAALLDPPAQTDGAQAPAAQSIRIRSVRGDTAYRVYSDVAERLADGTDPTDAASVAALHAELAHLGVYRALEAAGARRGDTILIGDLEMELGWRPPPEEDSTS